MAERNQLHGRSERKVLSTLSLNNCLNTGKLETAIGCSGTAWTGGPNFGLLAGGHFGSSALGAGAPGAEVAH